MSPSTPENLDQLEQAALHRSGPFVDALRRLQETSGNAAVRRLALDLVRTVPSLHHRHPDQLLGLLAAAIDGSDDARAALRRWLGSDTYLNREATKLIFEWGGAERIGEPLLQQVAAVCWLHASGQDAGPALAFLRDRLRALD